jgi:sulfhydrogenase subunit beta (sulfur reductase)
MNVGAFHTPERTPMTNHWSKLQIEDEVVFEHEDLQGLLDILRNRGYKIIGPTIRNGAITYDELNAPFDLPVGWRDRQDSGQYRLEKGDRETLFDYVVGPHSLKKYLHPPVVQLWRAERDGRGFRVIDRADEAPKYAFIGVRSCDIHAIAILDKVFNNGPFSDSIYNLRRQRTFTLAVNCTRPGGTCFCLSMNTGPKVTFGFDIALTEVVAEGRCYYVAKVGTEIGGDILGEMTYHDALEKEKREARILMEQASKQMGRTLNTSNLKAIFYDHFEHVRWEEVAARCLTCANCTMVCPTCFCTNVGEINALSGEYAERWRKWDSCFNRDFAYMHGGSIRASEKSRYRQWLTHKLATWMDQFGTFGCVGCGRCITWCPVGIDITEEAEAILEKRESLRGVKHE